MLVFSRTSVTALGMMIIFLGLISICRYLLSLNLCKNSCTSQQSSGITGTVLCIGVHVCTSWLILGAASGKVYIIR